MATGDIKPEGICMHTTTLDNGVRVHYDGGDIGGEVRFGLPDGRSVVTTWDRIIEGERMKLSEMPTLKLSELLRETEMLVGVESEAACALRREVHRRVEVNEWAQGWEKRIADFERRGAQSCSVVSIKPPPPPPNVFH